MPCGLAQGHRDITARLQLHIADEPPGPPDGQAACWLEAFPSPETPPHSWKQAALPVRLGLRDRASARKAASRERQKPVVTIAAPLLQKGPVPRANCPG